MSDWIAKLIWRVFRMIAARYSKVLTYAGPTAILAIIVSWAALTWFGFTLIYLPFLGSGFDFGQVHGGSPRQGIFEAMSISIGSLITLSDGAYARLHWLELACGVEAVMGFAILTASVSWLLSIYPVLEARRSVAQRATLLHHAERQHQLDMVRDAPDQAKEWAFSLGADLASLRNQMAQFPITYYFDMGEPETAISGALAYLLELSERASASSSAGLRLSASVLGGAVHSFLKLVAEDFLSIPSANKEQILRAYASEQMSEIILLRQTIPYEKKKDDAA